MRRFLFVTAALLLFLQTGCTQSIRYTEEEIKGYQPRIQEDIRKGQIEPGMTQEQVRYAWGSPDSITKLEAFESKSREEWLYSHPFTLGVVGSKLLVFFDGRLIYIK
jgi:outer membrane protein assembly factor BamE (lipoprotein component of BamABCDE complex)